MDRCNDRGIANVIFDMSSWYWELSKITKEECLRGCYFDHDIPTGIMINEEEEV